MRSVLGLFVFLVSIAVAATAIADVVHLKDGRKFEGEIVTDDGAKVVVKTRFGEVTIERSKVARIEKTVSQVEDLFGRVGEAVGADMPLRGHFHNTRNTGIANAYAAIKAGVRMLDSSIGGIGGCPFAPRATCNSAS